MIIDQAVGDVAAAQARNDGKAHTPEECFGSLDRMEAEQKGQQRVRIVASDEDRPCALP